MNKLILSKSDIVNIAKLAKLDLNQNEIEKFRSQLADIISYFNILEKVNTDKVEPTSQVTGLDNVFDKDSETASLSAKEATSGSKQIHSGMFKTGIVVTKV